MRRYSLRRLAWAGPLTAGAAGVVNLIYYWITKTIGEPYLLPLDAGGDQLAPMPLLMPVVGAVVIALLAALFFGLLIRYARQPVIVFVSVAVTALILSFGGSFGIPGAALATKLFLSGLNTLSAAVITGGLLHFSQEKDSTRIRRISELRE